MTTRYRIYVRTITGATRVSATTEAAVENELLEIKGWLETVISTSEEGHLSLDTETGWIIFPLARVVSVELIKESM